MLSVRRCVTESKCERGGLNSPDLRSLGTPFDLANAASFSPIRSCHHETAAVPGSVTHVATHDMIASASGTWKSTSALSGTPHGRAASGSVPTWRTRSAPSGYSTTLA
eukprot:5200080-Prymnesium_polylepis.1